MPCGRMVVVGATRPGPEWPKAAVAPQGHGRRCGRRAVGRARRSDRERRLDFRHRVATFPNPAARGGRSAHRTRTGAAPAAPAQLPGEQRRPENRAGSILRAAVIPTICRDHTQRLGRMPRRGSPEGSVQRVDQNRPKLIDLGRDGHRMLIEKRQLRHLSQITCGGRDGRPTGILSVAHEHNDRWKRTVPVRVYLGRQRLRLKPRPLVMWPVMWDFRAPEEPSPSTQRREAAQAGSPGQDGIRAGEGSCPESYARCPQRSWCDPRPRPFG